MIRDVGRCRLFSSLLALEAIPVSVLLAAASTVDTILVRVDSVDLGTSTWVKRDFGKESIKVLSSTRILPEWMRRRYLLPMVGRVSFIYREPGTCIRIS